MPTRADQYGASAALAVTINTFHVRHMVRVYQAFDGDLLEAIVLGEIAHHNLSGVLGQTGSSLEFARRLAARGRPSPQELLPTNAHSIALATGVPRETVRRKVAALVKRGWLTRDQRGNLLLTARPGAHFGRFTEESVRELLDVANAVALLTHRTPFATPPGPSAPRASRRRRR